MEVRDWSSFFELITETMNDGLLVIGRDGVIQRVNRAAERLSGYSRSELVGSPCTVLDCDVCYWARNHNGDGWCVLFSEGRFSMKRATIRRKDGTQVPVLKNAVILKDTKAEILGAVETLTDLSELDKLDQRVTELCRLISAGDAYCGMVGKSAVMRSLFEAIDNVARSDAPVLIQGESGSGKELVARAIHQRSHRKDGPFVELNCAALNEAILESELFGHAKGAFTGAYRDRPGRFEAADGGDLFLDEIGDVPLSVQVKLLRVIETKRFERVGELRSRSADVRIISATHQPLESLVKAKRFREDLYFRISVIPLYVPALRDRREDIPLLIDHFLRERHLRTGEALFGLSEEALEVCLSYDWPGNVRELQNALEYAAVTARSGLIRPEHLPRWVQAGKGTFVRPPKRPNSSSELPEKQALLEALERAGGNKTRAARLLGVNRNTVLNRMRKYGVDIRRSVVSSETPAESTHLKT